jgi:hypothetical protein
MTAIQRKEVTEALGEVLSHMAELERRGALT